MMKGRREREEAEERGGEEGRREESEFIRYHSNTNNCQFRFLAGKVRMYTKLLGNLEDFHGLKIELFC